MSDRSIAMLERATEEFLNRYWNSTAIGQTPPSWDGSYNFTGALPNGDKKGCYAVEKEGEIIYVGSGIGRGAGIYEGHGLGARIGHIIKWDKTVPAQDIASRVYVLRPGWEGISRIWTIGFDTNHACLALALEAFLIAKLRPVKNVRFNPK